MTLGDRGFVEFLVKKIEKEGILGCGYDTEEIKQDIISMIWDAYDEF
ncbi:MAG TPA: hypothetical protein VIM70_09770 [Clostridium sp.]